MDMFDFFAVAHASAFRRCWLDDRVHGLCPCPAVVVLRFSSRVSRRLRQLEVAYDFARHVSATQDDKFLKQLDLDSGSLPSVAERVAEHVAHAAAEGDVSSERCWC